MPHVSEVRATDHDRHEPMLVAALAAGDLAGADRDQAIAMTRSCAECEALHGDLVAIARATAAVAPPIASARRDFRLTPQQAAGLRRTGWRRLVPAAIDGSMARPLGAALATFGIAGILIGSLSLGFSAGSSAAAPQPAAGSGSAADRNAFQGSSAASTVPEAALQPVPAASAAAASAAPAPAASAAAAAPSADTAGGVGNADGAEPAASSPTSVAIAAAPSLESITKEQTTPTELTATGSTGGSWSPLLIVSAMALVIGVALLVLARRRENERR